MCKLNIGRTKEKFYIDSQKSLLFFCLIFTFTVTLAAPVFAQQEQSVDVAPPPLKFVSKNEKTQLSAETNVKKRTVLALTLMDARLVSAETFINQKQYDKMFDELGGFHALIDDTLNYLIKYDSDSGKILNNFKRLEMSLRKYSPRLELIRREVPNRYEPYLRGLIIDLRLARSKAVEPLFSNSIVPDDNQKKPDEN